MAMLRRTAPKVTPADVPKYIPRAIAAGHRQASVKQYCAEIEEAARHRLDLIIPELAKRYGVTEKLKAENPLEWVRQMNACKAQAEEVVLSELVYN